MAPANCIVRTSPLHGCLYLSTHPFHPHPCSGAMAPANYIVRTNTTGGLRPEKCDAPPGQWVTVPYTGAGEGYLCL